jgi:hypothetical protein
MIDQNNMQDKFGAKSNSLLVISYLLLVIRVVVDHLHKGLASV